MRRPRRGAVALLAALLSIAVLPLVSATPATAQSDATVVVDGRGWGHGRGMSQWGALGYAVNYGWSAGQILDHYYGGTVNGGADDHNLRVLLQGQTGPSVILYHPLGQLRTSADGDQASRAALRMDRLADGTWQLYDGASCAGPWTPWGGPTATTAITAWPVAETDDPSSSVQVCDATGARAYRGHLELRATNGGVQTLNVVPRENYLRSVVALEVSASWWDIGRVAGVDGSGGGQAVMAQAVAARSYVEAGDTRYVSSTADTCDSTLCQVYGGRARRTTGALASIEHPNIDAALYHTRNTIRVHGNSAVARTEFSSSTGGHTAGGTFPAVPDLGDAYAGNPNYRWQQTIAVSSIESAFGAGLGQFVGMAVVSTDGNGDDGGRATNVRFVFTGGSINRTGDQVRAALGLKSTWFRVSGGTALLRNYVNGAYEVLLRRTADQGGRDYWAGQLAAGMPRTQFGLALARTPEWVNVVITDLYDQVFGRGPDPAGLAYWAQQIGSGMRVANLASNLYASEEFFSNSGNTIDAWVDALYRNILGREPDAGRAYWVTQVAAGVPRQAAANALFLSYESNVQRVDGLYDTILGRTPDVGGRDYWGKQLAALDDINLAALLVASDEFFSNNLEG